MGKQVGRGCLPIYGRGEEDMSDKCYMYKGHYIPGCMGGAVYGKRGCTCEKKTNGDRIAELEAEVAKLRAIIDRLLELTSLKEWVNKKQTPGFYDGHVPGK